MRMVIEFVQAVMMLDAVRDARERMRECVRGRGGVAGPVWSRRRSGVRCGGVVIALVVGCGSRKSLVLAEAAA